MTAEHAHLAIHCGFLQRAIAVGAADPVLTLCRHPVREGKECVGPFLEDLITDCGLWEPARGFNGLVPTGTVTS